MDSYPDNKKNCEPHWYRRRRRRRSWSHCYDGMKEGLRFLTSSTSRCAFHSRLILFVILLIFFTSHLTPWRQPITLSTLVVPKSHPNYTIQTTIHAKNSSTTNKTLVLVVGNLRGGEGSWQSLYRHVLDINRADLALMIGAVPSANQTFSSSMYARAKYIWEFPEFDDWGTAIDWIGTPTHEKSRNGKFTWRDIAKRTTKRHLFGGTAVDPKGSGAINYMARYFATQEIQKLNLTSIYTTFVFTRSDHFYLCDHNFHNLQDHDTTTTTNTNNMIWLPEGEDYHGIEDRHFVTSSQLFLPAMNIFPPIVLNPIKYINISKDTNPEMLTMLRWTEDGLYPKYVRRFPRMMFLAAVPNVDTSRWSNPLYIITSGPATGLGIKYMTEWEKVQATCQTNYSIANATTIDVDDIVVP